MWDTGHKPSVCSPNCGTGRRQIALPVLLFTIGSFGGFGRSTVVRQRLCMRNRGLSYVDSTWSSLPTDCRLRTVCEVSRSVSLTPPPPVDTRLFSLPPRATDPAPQRSELAKLSVGFYGDLKGTPSDPSAAAAVQGWCICTALSLLLNHHR